VKLIRHKVSHRDYARLKDFATQRGYDMQTVFEAMVAHYLKHIDRLEEHDGAEQRGAENRRAAGPPDA
jgi:hypothetical protein